MTNTVTEADLREMLEEVESSVAAGIGDWRFKDDKVKVSTMRQIITLALQALSLRTPSEGDLDEEDLASDDRWNKGVNYAIERLCEILGVDPKAISWDAATETVNGDVMSVICNVLVAAYGEEWSSNERDTAIIRNALSPHKPVSEAVAETDEAYEIGKRDGYEEAVQGIDILTGGDGEYRYCTDGDPDRHTPDAATMKQRIVDRFAEASRPSSTLLLIDELRREEGDQVTILCDNPDFNGQPNNAVVISAGWTNWQDFRVSGHTLENALSNAVAIKAMAPGDRPVMPSPPDEGLGIEVRGPCIPVTYCGLATSTHVPLGSDEDHCDLCGYPAQPYAQVIPPPAYADLRETMWATVVYEGEDNSFRFELNEEGNRDGPHYDRSIEFAADTFPVGTKIIVYEPGDDESEAALKSGSL